MTTPATAIDAPTAGRRGHLTLDELKEAVRTGEIDTVVCAITDMQGRMMGKRVRGAHFIDHAHHGVHFCTYLLGTEMEMETPDGFALMSWETGYGDWLAVPDWETLRRIPWLEGTALVLCDPVDEATGAPIPISPRGILKRQIERAAALGFEAKMAGELEFYLLDDSYEEAAEKGFQNLKRSGWYNEDYHLLQATKAEPFYRQLRNDLSAAGIPVEFSKGEAAPGQHEINFRYAPALEAADRHALFKHGVKEMAVQRGKAVTFMAKPYADWTGSSAHVHVSLWNAKNGRSVFHEATGGPGDMTETMRHFLGGMIRAGRELAYFIAPFVNSYKRYARGSWAPVSLVWGRDNRTTGFRVVGFGNDLRIENRFPGGDANPYLAYAAVLGAGLWGIEHRIELPAEHQGNGYVADGAPRVPAALWEAAAELEKSAIAREIFGEEVVAHYLNAARVEQDAFDRAVTSWERARYLERG
jgi:glutamine synthetase